MKCPNCGTEEKALVKLCHSCGEAFASQDLLELYQLQFLVDETAKWEIPQGLRLPYAQRLVKLRERLTRHAAPEPEAVVEVAPKPAVSEPVVPTPAPAPAAVVEKPMPKPVPPPKPAPPPKPQAPPKEAVPFDQWLLSERNIKIALYSGGLLLVIAGLIFIGVNWTRIPGPGKFAITLMITGLMYLGGYLLFQRPAYRIGGVALLGVASGFLTLNFAVLQIYVLGPKGLQDDVMWLIASPMCLLLYMLTAYWTRGDLFTYISLAALGSTATAALVVAGAPLLVFALLFALLALGILVLAHGLRNTSLADFAYQPMRIVSHIVIPLAFGTAFYFLLAEAGCTVCPDGAPWLALPAMIAGLIFYVLNAYWGRNPVFTTLSLAGLIAVVWGTMTLINALGLVYPLVYALLALGLLILARALKASPLAGFTDMPLRAVSHILMPLSFVTAFGILLSEAGCTVCRAGNPWLALPAMVAGLIFYALNAFWERLSAFTYLSLTGVLAVVWATMTLINALLLVYPLVYALLALGFLVLARALNARPMGDFTKTPILITSHLIVPAVIVAAISGWVFETGCTHCDWGGPWLALTILGLAVLFYIATDALFKQLAARWVAALLLPLGSSLTMLELGFSDLAMAVTLMALALAYLGVGYLLEGREGKRASGWPLYATAYAVAAFVTMMALPDTEDLMKVLFGDVILLAVSAAIHRDYRWVYAAAWLFMLPVYLLISLYVPEFHYQGLLMGVLGLNYCVFGYILGRRSLWLGGPFLSAAVFLSVLVVALTWGNPTVASLVLVVIAALYLLAALWLGWNWLLLATLLAANLAVLSTNLIFFQDISALQNPLIISYFALGVVSALVGLWLRRSGESRWTWPLYITGGLNLAGAYLSVLLVAGWLAVGISTILVILLLAFAWLERRIFAESKFPPLLSYLGIGVLSVAHFYVINLLAGDRALEIWPPITAALCALFVALAWGLRRQPLAEIYATPVRYSGLSLMVVPLVGSFVTLDPVVVAATFAIAGAIFTIYGAMRRILSWAYLGIGAFLIVIWASLIALEITEPQAYVMPLGLTLLGAAWYERWKMGGRLYRILSILGLVLLLGSAFYQSLPKGAYIYAVLLLIECLVFIALGVGARSRCYVQLGGLALIANAIVQLGPGFIDLPRWVQIGVTGGILLGGGLAALFKREEILIGRQKLTEDWRQWNP